MPVNGESTQVFQISPHGPRRSFRCACGANVFTRHPSPTHGEQLFACNGCGERYVGTDPFGSVVLDESGPE